ncbi:MAG: hypothetical protein Q9162_004056 [Coniocarpon cinnabarinum]
MRRKPRDNRAKNALRYRQRQELAGRLSFNLKDLRVTHEYAPATFSASPARLGVFELKVNGESILHGHYVPIDSCFRNLPLATDYHSKGVNCLKRNLRPNARNSWGKELFVIQYPRKHGSWPAWSRIVSNEDPGRQAWLDLAPEFDAHMYTTRQWKHLDETLKIYLIRAESDQPGLVSKIRIRTGERVEEMTTAENTSVAPNNDSSWRFVGRLPCGARLDIVFALCVDMMLQLFAEIDASRSTTPDQQAQGSPTRQQAAASHDETISESKETGTKETSHERRTVDVQSPSVAVQVQQTPKTHWRRFATGLARHVPSLSHQKDSAEMRK